LFEAIIDSFEPIQKGVTTMADAVSRERETPAKNRIPDKRINNQRAGSVPTPVNYEQVRAAPVVRRLEQRDTSDL
jgi:hypothetical protein